MDEAEREIYVKILEERVTSLTAQLREAVGRLEKLTHEVIDAVPALRKVSDDPAAQKLIERFGNHSATQEIEAKLEPMHALISEVNAGAPIPPVSAADVKQLWDASRRMNADRPPRPNYAIGLDVYAAYGVEAAADPERFMAVQWRHSVLSDLLERGVLAEYLRDGEPDDRIFTAAATMPCTKDDLGQAMLPKLLAQMPADEAEKVREGMKAGGFDPVKPNIDGKFLRWLQDSC